MKNFELAWSDLDRGGDVVVAGLAGSGHAFIKLRDPAAVIPIGLVFHPFANSVELIIGFEPAEPVADKAEYRIVPIGFDPKDHHARQHLLLDCEGNHARVEMPERHPPFLRQQMKRIFRAIVQFGEILRFDEKPVLGRRGEARGAQFRQPRHREIRRGQDFGLPRGGEVFDAKQPDGRSQQLLLHREQRWQLDIVRVQLDLDHRLVEDLEFDKAEILYRKGRAVVIRVEVAQRGKELGAVLHHPAPIGGDQHGKAFHGGPRNTAIDPRTRGRRSAMLDYPG